MWVFGMCLPQREQLQVGSKFEQTLVCQSLMSYVHWWSPPSKPMEGVPARITSWPIINQINLRTTIVSIHLINETWQYYHVWHIPLELEQVYYIWWCNFHYILHQFGIWQQNSMSKSPGMNDFWHIDPWVLRLYWTHWWDLHWYPKILEKCCPWVIVQWAEKNVLCE